MDREQPSSCDAVAQNSGREDTLEYTVQAVERATGVAGSRLRTWERRYGIPSPLRSATGRRLYSESDVQVIRRMAALIDAGVSAAQAAGEARNGGVGTPDALEAPRSDAAERVSPLAHEVLEAARTLDGRGVDAGLQRAFSTLGTAEALVEVVFPALRLVGDEWASGRFSVAHEHLLAECVRLRMAAVAAMVPARQGPVDVVLAGPDGELHDLALLGLRLLLAEAGVVVCYLGANVPAPALTEAVEHLRPHAVALSATSSVALPTLGLAARALLSSHWHGRIFFGGLAVASGDPAAQSIPGTRLPVRIDEAVNAIVRHITDARGVPAPRV